VVEVARRMGLASSIQATPAVALGAYEMTPLEVAAGYTAFAEGGVRAEPYYLKEVVSLDGTVQDQNKPRTHQVLDPRTAFLVTNVMEDVINRGTAYPVRARGFNNPAAGKTGTSRAAWFAGFTSNLLCVVWVGFDDNHDLTLAGGVSAAPVWAEFMKRAVTLPAYKDTKNFAPPEGIVSVSIDPETLQLATPNCPATREEYFVEGTQPTVYCQKHGGSAGGTWLSRLFGGDKPTESATPNPNVTSAIPNSATSHPAPGAPGWHKFGDQATPAQQSTAQKSAAAKPDGFWHKFKNLFGGKDADADSKKKTDPGKPPGG
jgi:penicillin-binding protein 1B